MKITIDTNVIASALFFVGRPRQLLEELLENKIEAVVSPDILIEYQETFAELRSRRFHWIIFINVIGSHFSRAVLRRPY